MTRKQLAAALRRITDGQDLATPAEVAAYLRVPVGHVARRLRATLTVGREKRYHVEDVARAILSQQEAA